MKMKIRRQVSMVVCALVVLLIFGTPASRAQDLTKLATDLAARIHAAKHQRVTVVDFVDLDKKPNKLGQYLAQQLQTTLAEPDYKIEVIDQSHLGQLLEQMEKLNEGILDPATGRQLGKIAGTEVLIVGMVMPSSLTVRLDVKAIDLQTAKVIMGGSTSLARIGLIDRLVSSSGEEVAASDSKGKAGSGASNSSGKSAAHTPARTIRDQGTDFELEGCSVSGNALTCAISVTSESRDRWLAVTFGSRAWNVSGEEFEPGEVSIANLNSNNRDCAARQILKGVPTRVTMTFKNFGDDATVERFRLAWKEDQYCGYGNWRPVDFEKIAVSDTDFSSPKHGSHAGGGSSGSADGKGKGGFFDQLKGRAMDIINKKIDKKTDELIGDDDQDGDSQNTNTNKKKKSSKPPQQQ